MKVLYVSDLHIDVNAHILGISQGEVERTVIDVLKDMEAQGLVIGGDSYNDMEKSLKFNERVKEETGMWVKFVPGNHDVGVLKGMPKGSSDVAWESYINHESALIGAPKVIGKNKVLIGALGWYDYSFKMSGADDDLCKQQKKRLWYDGKHVKFSESDQEVTERELARLEKDLGEWKGYEIGVVTHFVPFRECLVTKNDWNWNFSNAYLGSENVGKMLERHDDVKKVFFGHTHTEFNKEVGNGIQAFTSPFGYVGEWNTGDLLNELHQKIVVLDV